MVEIIGRAAPRKARHERRGRPYPRENRREEPERRATAAEGARPTTGQKISGRKERGGRRSRGERADARDTGRDVVTMTRRDAAKGRAGWSAGGWRRAPFYPSSIFMIARRKPDRRAGSWLYAEGGRLFIPPPLSGRPPGAWSRVCLTH